MDDVIAPYGSREKLAGTGMAALVDLIRSPLADHEWSAIELATEAMQDLAASVVLPDIGHSFAALLSECSEALSSIGGLSDAALTPVWSEALASARAMMQDVGAGGALGGLAGSRLGASVAGASTWNGLAGALAELVDYQRAELADIQAGLWELLPLHREQATLLMETEDGGELLGARELRVWAEEAAEPLLGFGEIPLDQIILRGQTWQSLPALPPAIAAASSSRAQETLHGLAQQYAQIAQLGTAVAMLQRLYLEAAESADQDGGRNRDAIRQLWVQLQALISRSHCHLLTLAAKALMLARSALQGSEDGGRKPPCTRSSYAPRGPPRGRHLLANHQGRSSGEEQW